MNKSFNSFTFEESCKVYGVGLVPDGSFLVTINKKYEMNIWDLSTFHKLSSTQTKTLGSTISFNKSNTYIAIAGYPSLIQIWNISNRNKPKLIIQYKWKEFIFSVNFGISDTLFFVRDSMKVITLNLNGSKWSRIIKNPIYKHFDSDISSDCQIMGLCIQEPDPYVQIYEISTNNKIVEWIAHNETTSGLQFSKNKTQILTYGCDEEYNILKIWNLERILLKDQRYFQPIKLFNYFLLQFMSYQY